MKFLRPLAPATQKALCSAWSSYNMADYQSLSDDVGHYPLPAFDECVACYYRFGDYHCNIT